MKFTVKNTKGKKVLVFDNVGRKIYGVTFYDTKTFKISFYPIHVNDLGKKTFMSELDEDGKGKTKKITTTWRGSYATVDGVRVK